MRVTIQATAEEISALLAAAKETAEEGTNEKKGVVNHDEGGNTTGSTA